jgi:hypothetical protein
VVQAGAGWIRLPAMGLSDGTPGIAGVFDTIVEIAKIYPKSRRWASDKHETRWAIGRIPGRASSPARFRFEPSREHVNHRSGTESCDAIGRDSLAF